MRLLALLVGLAIVPAVHAQSAAEVLRDALDRYEADLADVEDYTITQSAIGFETTTYAERRDGGDPLDYATYTVTPAGLQEVEGETSSLYLMYDRIAARADYAGREDVEGEETHVIVIEDLGEMAQDFQAFPEGADGEFEPETLTLYLDTDDSRAHKMVMEGTMRRDGQASPVTMVTRFYDYRTVDGFTTPFRTTMEIEGAAAGIGPEEREEARRGLEEARRQMESMSAEQRQMMERMMGDRLEQLEQMLGGESIRFEMEVKDVKVNTGRPN